MRISDWSSDVCSSDLRASGAYVAPEKEIIALIAYLQHLGKYEDLRPAPAVASSQRSEERRVGKECVSTCRSRWSPYHLKKNILHSNILTCSILIDTHRLSLTINVYVISIALPL